MLNYYHRHLPNLVHILEPLHKLLHKNSKWDWGKEQIQSFEKINKYCVHQSCSSIRTPKNL